MVIGIDGNEANVQKSVGVSVYTHELLKYFAQKASKNLQFIVYLRTPRRKNLPRPTKYFQYKVINAPRLWRDFKFPLYLYTHREIDVLFSPAHYSPRFCPVPVVVTIHDLAYEYFPHEFLRKDLFKLKNWTPHATRQARKVIAVSKSTKKDIQKFYKTSSKKIEVVHNGFKTYRDLSGRKTTAQVLKKYKLVKSEYILYVGTLQPRKNITTLIKAFERVHKVRPYAKLVIAGKKGWLYHEFFAVAEELGLKNVIKFPGYVSDTDLPHLYRGAGAYVLPSLYEGFGIPILEAMYQGCPVIASKASSLPEVGADACIYFNPKDETQLRKAILDVLGKESLRKSLIKKGKERAKLFSSKKMAQETLDIIKSAVSS